MKSEGSQTVNSPSVLGQAAELGFELAADPPILHSASGRQPASRVSKLYFPLIGVAGNMELGVSMCRCHWSEEFAWNG